MIIAHEESLEIALILGSARLFAHLYLDSIDYAKRGKYQALVVNHQDVAYALVHL